MIMWWKMLIVLFLVCLPIAGCRPGDGNHANNDPVYGATVVAPYLEHAVPKSHNLIYCNTFQIAWRELRDSIVGGPIAMEAEIPLVGFLNTGAVSTAAAADYVAMAGFGRDHIVASINGELVRKFGEAAPSIKTELEEDDILAYAYLFKNLLFEDEFEDIEQPLFFQGAASADVRAFGIEKFDHALHEKMGAQVRILDYQDDLDFILTLSTTSPTDIMVLALVEPRKTLLETYSAVEERIAHASPERLKKDDVLKIPKIAFDIEHSYGELLNKAFKNEGFTDYFIAEALQAIRFKLDQKGALLESESEIVLKKNGNEGRYLVFSQPFLLYLKEEDGPYPYLAVWVNDPEILIEAPIDGPGEHR